MKNFLFFALAFVFGALQAQNIAYVSNFDDGTISVVNVQTNKLVNTIPVDAGPLGIAFTPDGQFAYVANQTAGVVDVIEVAMSRVIDTIIGNTPEQIAITPDGSYAYVTNFTGMGTVGVIETASNTQIAVITIGVALVGIDITPDGKYAYVTDNANSVHVISTVTNSVSTSILVGGALRGIAITPNGERAYVSNISSDVVNVINTKNNTVTGAISVGNFPFDIGITPDGSYAYVTNTNDGTVSVINTESNTVSTVVTVGVMAEGVGISFDGSFAYVTNSDTPGYLVTIETANNTVTASVEVGAEPRWVALAPLIFELSGVSKKNSFLTQTEFFNVLTWTRVDQATSYEIFRNGKKVATVSASGNTSFEDHNLKKNTSYSYMVVAKKGSFTLSEETVNLRT